MPKQPSNILKVPLKKKKRVELRNLPRIPNHASVTSSFPNELPNFEVTPVAYTLEKSLQSKIFNFCKFILSLNLEVFIRPNSILPCHCTDSYFNDKDHGHILTRDLRITKINKLRKFFTTTLI